MAVNIYQGLLNNPEDSCLDLGRKTGEGWVEIQFNVDFAASAKTAGVPFNRAGQAGFIQHWWM